MELAGRRALVITLPMLAVLLVAAAIGASPGVPAGHSQASPSAVSAIFSVLTVLVAFALVYVIVVMLISVFGGRRAPDAEQFGGWRKILLELVLGIATLAAVAGSGLVLWLLLRHHRVDNSTHYFGGEGASHAHKAVAGKPVPFSFAYGGGTAVAVCLIVVAVLLAHRLRRRWRRGIGVPDWSEIAEEHAAAAASRQWLADAVESVGIHDPADEPDPRRAVMKAWIAMTEAFAAVGHPRLTSETPREYIHRVLVDAGARPESAAALTDLFEIARWSTHAMGEQMRARAIEALADVRQDVAAHAAAERTPGQPVSHSSGIT
ncbi:MAG TPA: DUF4129 domain-containing protein [Acidimicrobiales bacterium]|nr:DUF4129 domain-containing protein [Acidimicrobiales bacterium]